MPNENPNPKHQKILDVLPPELHSLVIPVLKEWDQGVQQKLEEVRSEFKDLEAYKPFVENNIDPKYAEQAVIFADQLQRDPAKVVSQLNETWNLGYLSKEQAEELRSQGGSQDPNDLDDLDTDDPKLKKLYEGMEALQKEIEDRKRQEEEEEELSEFEDYMDELEKTVTEKNLPFNRTFVTALMTQGIDGEEAVKQYHQVLAGNAATSTDDSAGESTEQSNDDPPAVMGSDGTAGSGTSSEVIKFGELSKNSLNETVEQLIQQAQQAGQG